MHIISLKYYILVKVLHHFYRFFYVLLREKIRMKKFSIFSKIYTKNGSKIEIFILFSTLMHIIPLKYYIRVKFLYHFDRFFTVFSREINRF